MIIPYLRQDLEIFRGNSREDGSPAWLLYDAVRNKYFTVGLTAFRLIKNWRGGEDIQNFEKKINSQGIETTGDEIKSFIGFLQQNNLIIQPQGQGVPYLMQQKNSLKKSWIMRLVIIPQALRVIVPPLTSQYLNLTKNSSLAAAIAYPDLVLVFAGTALMQTGRAIEIISITMLTYLTLSILISMFMNWYNRKMAIKEK